jgi:hypothetical protein
MVKEE